MKFEVSERIRSTASSEKIISAATAHFKKVSESVSRSGQSIIIESIEASFGSINRSDTTTITLQKTQGGHILLADVYYRPSVAFWIILVLTLFTWVFWLIPIVFYLTNKNVVRTAIEQCFKRIRDEFEQQSASLDSAPMVASLEALEKLAELKAKGIVTEAEFAEKKKQILGLQTDVSSPDEAISEAPSVGIGIVADRCPGCSAKISDSDNECPKCGLAFASDADDESASSGTESSANPQSRGARESIAPSSDKQIAGWDDVMPIAIITAIFVIALFTYMSH